MRQIGLNVFVVDRTRDLDSYAALAERFGQIASVHGGGQIVLAPKLMGISFPPIEELSADNLYQQMVSSSDHFEGQVCARTSGRSVDCRLFFGVQLDSGGKGRVILTPENQVHLFSHLLIGWLVKLNLACQPNIPIEERRGYTADRHYLIFNTAFRMPEFKNVAEIVWGWLGEALLNGAKYPTLRDAKIKFQYLEFVIRPPNVPDYDDRSSTITLASTRERV